MEVAAAQPRSRLEKIAQIVAHDYQLSLDFGRRNQTDGRRIVVGVVPERVPATQYRVLKGLALHTVAHILVGSLAAEQRARLLEATHPSIARFWHALEDARVENALVKRLPGTAKGFRAALIAALPSIAGDTVAPVTQIELGLYLAGRGSPATWLDRRVLELMEELRGPIGEACAAGDSGRLLDILLLIYPRLYDLLEELGQPVQDESCAPEEGEGEEPQEQEALQAEEAGGDDEEEECIQLLTQGQQVPQWQRPGTLPWFEKEGHPKNVHPSAVCGDRESIVVPPRGDHREYMQIAGEVRREVNYLKTRLTNLIREQQYLRFAGSYRSGKLNQARLWRQRTGRYNLFQRKVEPARRSVAFALLVDESGSMNKEDKYLPARRAAIMFGEVLEGLGVPFEIIGYSTADPEPKMAMKLGLSPAYKYRHTRCSRLQHFLYKRFDEPYGAVRDRLLTIQPRNNNWDEEHLAFAYRRLRGRREADRVIILISDGQPNGDASHLVRTVQEIERMGTKVIGVGVGCDYVKEIYRNYLIVESMAQLGEELVRILQRELLASGPSSSSTLGYTVWAKSG